MYQLSVNHHSRKRRKTYNGQQTDAAADIEKKRYYAELSG